MVSYQPSRHERVEEIFEIFQAEVLEVFGDTATNFQSHPNKIQAAAFCFECNISYQDQTREIRILSVPHYPGIYGSINPHFNSKDCVYRASTIKDALQKLKAKLEIHQQLP